MTSLSSLVSEVESIDFILFRVIIYMLDASSGERKVLLKKSIFSSPERVIYEHFGSVDVFLRRRTRVRGVTMRFFARGKYTEDEVRDLKAKARQEAHAEAGEARRKVENRNSIHVELLIESTNLGSALADRLGGLMSCREGTPRLITIFEIKVDDMVVCDWEVEPGGVGFNIRISRKSGALGREAFIPFGSTREVVLAGLSALIIEVAGLGTGPSLVKEIRNSGAS